MIELNSRHRKELRAVLRAGRISRSQLAQATGVRKNTLLGDVAGLIEAGILREADANVPSGGRPRTPLELDAERRAAVGLSIQPGRVELARADLLGRRIGRVEQAEVSRPGELILAAERLLRAHLDERVLVVGLTAPGFIDRQTLELRFSAAWPEARPLSLQPLAALGEDRPLVLENDVNARAGQWLAQAQPPQRQDTLFVVLDDGRLGATLLIEGRPNRGSIGGANELGHTRLPVATEACYCGHSGCLERIFSSAFLQAHDPAGGTLAERLQGQGELHADETMRRMLDWVGYGLANALNLLRVEALVLSSPLPGAADLLQLLTETARRYMLAELAGRLNVQHQADASTRPADAAAQLALARLFYDGWEVVGDF